MSKKYAELKDGMIYLLALIPKEEIGDLIEQLRDLQKSCIDATIPQPPTVIPLNSYFDSIKDETVMTVEITNQIIIDLQKLNGIEGGDIRKTFVELINYYSDHDSLNLILTHDVLETRQSYAKYTNQLAQYLRTHQRNYRQVRVEFDSANTRLGIFCRKDTDASPLTKSLINSIAAMLKVHRSAQVAIADIPISYITNKAAIKHLLKYELGVAPRLEWGQDYLKIFLPNLK